MGLLQTMNSLFRRPAKPAGAVLDFSDSGFTCTGASSWRATWLEVRRITSYKLHRFVVDEIRVDFELQDGVTRVITEECSGFEGLMLELVRRFPTVSGWHGRVAHPAFAPSVSVLFEREN